MALPVELGPRAAEVMRFIWASEEPVPGRVICEVLHTRHQIAYTTVIGTLDRLVRQGVLERDTNQHGTITFYCPTCTPEAFVQQAMVQLRTLVGLGG